MNDFDCIIMNPPYDKNTHLKILDNVIEEFKEAEVVNLAPCHWLTDPLVDYCSNEKYFKDFREKIKNKLCDDIETIDKDTFNKEFGASSFFGVAITHYKKGQNFDINQYKNKDPLTNKILTQLTKLPSLRQQFIRKKDDPLFVPVRRRTHHYLKFADCNSNAKEGILFSSKEEKDNFVNSFDTWIYKWLNQFEMGENSAQVPFFNDYTSPWTDQRFYEYFDLTSEEIKEIEETMSGL